MALNLIDEEKISKLAECAGYEINTSPEIVNNNSYDVVIGEQGQELPCDDFTEFGNDNIGAGIVVKNGYCQGDKNIDYAYVPNSLNIRDVDTALKGCDDVMSGGSDGDRDSLYMEDLEEGDGFPVITINRVKNNEIVRDYIVALLQLVGKRDNNCFVKGAFVIQDPDYQLFRLLAEHMNDEIKFKGFKSHMKYNINDKDYSSQWMVELQNNLPVNRPTKFTYKFDYPCEVWINDLKHTCNYCNETVTYKNIKWYPFPGNGGVNHIYLKLEGFPTIGLLHLKQWIKRHTLKPIAGKIKRFFKKKVEKSNNKCLTFREDCETERNCRLKGDNLKLDSYSSETYSRRGDELYVSAEINNELLGYGGGRKAKRTRKTRRKLGTRKTKRTRKTRRKLGTRKTKRTRRTRRK